MSQYILTLDSSQIYELQTCPLRWLYKYKENLQLAGLKSDAPDKGTLIHHLCDLYYNFLWKGANSIEASNKAIEVFKERNLTLELFPEDKDHTLENFLISRFTLYTQRYANNDFILPKGDVSPVELGFSKLLYEDIDAKFIVEGRIDLVNIINGTVPCWTDHKTQSKESNLYNYKPQFKTYAWATGYEYAIINYIGLQEDKNNEKLKKGTLFRRNLIHFPKPMIEEWEHKMLEIFHLTHLMLTWIEGNEKVGRQLEESFYLNRNDSACAGAFDSNPCQFCYICEEFNWDMKDQIKAFKYNKRPAWSPWNLESKVKEV
jgi:hypothetical protein